MNIAALLFGCVVAIMAGAGLHFWRGGSLGRLIYYVLVSLVGFWVGHFLGEILGIRFVNVGAVNFGPALLMDFVFLAGGYWLGLVRPIPPQR